MRGTGQYQEQFNDREQLSDLEPFYATLEELASVVTAFEQGNLSRSRWNHRTHLAVASWYLLHLEEAEATQRIRCGIRHYNQCQGIPNTTSSGYHETLTLFWTRMIRRFLEQASANCPGVDLVNGLLAKYGDRQDLWRDYYSFDLVNSVEARRSWVEPDRRTLSDHEKR